MEVDLSAVVQAYRERVDALTYENTLLTVALKQSQDELGGLRANATPESVNGAG